MPYKTPEERAAYSAIWRARNREKILENRKRYFSSHKERMRKKSAAWRTKNADRVRTNSFAYRNKNAEVIHRKKANANALNPEKNRARALRWVKENPEKAHARNAQRRSRKRNAPINDFTAQQWSAMQAAYAYRCVYCKKQFKGKLTQDHIQPLSKGGSHTFTNIVPACRSCNSKKHDGLVLKPVQPLLFV